MTSSTKPEVHNLLHCHQLTCTENFVKFGHVVFEIYERIKRHTEDRHADRHTKLFIAVLPPPIRGSKNVEGGKFICNSPVFSEREFTFAICYRPSFCLSSVCRLSVCNVRAPYSGGSNFRQYFYGIRYIDQPLTSTENFTEIVPGKPLRRGS